MIDLVSRIKEVWQNKRSEAFAHADKITDALQTIAPVSTGAELKETILDEAYSHFEKNFDSQFGGFGASPKFPTPHNLLFLLRYWKRTGEDKRYRWWKRRFTHWHQVVSTIISDMDFIGIPPIDTGYSPTSKRCFMTKL